MNKNRLLWASRRGMLELDLSLQPFTQNHYDSLEESDQLRYETLLECEDQNLFLWLMNREQAKDPDTQRIVQIIRDSRKKAWQHLISVRLTLFSGPSLGWRLSYQLFCWVCLLSGGPDCRRFLSLRPQ